ncbi:MAG: TerB family tellurite resistance protein [Paludibacteraceae bacterium]|nr:TerB family tellurite resistance protein [Paludibacteraceae bacterium]
MGLSYIVVLVFVLILLFGVVGFIARLVVNRLNPDEKNVDRKIYEPRDYMSDFQRCVLVLLADVMKVDGVEHKYELSRVKSTIARYYSNSKERATAFADFQNILKQDFNTASICSLIKRKRLNYVDKAELIMELCAVAYADGIVTKEERNQIERIASYLGLTGGEIKSIFAIFMEKYNQGYYRVEYMNDDTEEQDDFKEYKTARTTVVISLKNAYEILQVSENDSDEDIKKSYRNLAKHYHPDNMLAGEDEKERQANESMKKINEAWTAVKIARGIK